MGVYAEKRKEKNKTKKPHASACVSLNPEACNPPLTKYFFRGVWGGGEATITAGPEKLGSQEGTLTNKWESELLLFKVLSNVNLIFSLVPTFSNVSKAVLAICPSEGGQPSSPSPPGPRLPAGPP